MVFLPARHDHLSAEALHAGAVEGCLVALISAHAAERVNEVVRVGWPRGVRVHHGYVGVADPKVAAVHRRVLRLARFPDTPQSTIVVVGRPELSRKPGSDPP